MPEDECDWLRRHLDDQVRTLSRMTAAAVGTPDQPQVLIEIRDQIFVIRETLESLGVPHATSTHEEWRRAIGTSDATST